MNDTIALLLIGLILALGLAKMIVLTMRFRLRMKIYKRHKVWQDQEDARKAKVSADLEYWRAKHAALTSSRK